MLPIRFSPPNAENIEFRYVMGTGCAGTNPYVQKELFSCSLKRWASDSISAWSSSGFVASATRASQASQTSDSIGDLLKPRPDFSLDIVDELGLEASVGGPQFRVHSVEQNVCDPEFGALGAFWLLASAMVR